MSAVHACVGSISSTGVQRGYGICQRYTPVWGRSPLLAFSVDMAYVSGTRLCGVDLLYWRSAWIWHMSAVHACVGSMYSTGVQRGYGICQRYTPVCGRCILLAFSVDMAYVSGTRLCGVDVFYWRSAWIWHMSAVHACVGSMYSTGVQRGYGICQRYTPVWGRSPLLAFNVNMAYVSGIRLCGVDVFYWRSAWIWHMSALHACVGSITSTGVQRGYGMSAVHACVGSITSTGVQRGYGICQRYTPVWVRCILLAFSVDMAYVSGTRLCGVDVFYWRSA